MAIIPQKKLFAWTELQTLGDLERLRLVLAYLPGEELMVKLERERGKGRDEYPIRAMWNSVLAGIVYQHEGVEKLRRELARNGQLREMCGFNDRVPPPWVYTRFLKTLIKNESKCRHLLYKYFLYRIELYTASKNQVIYRTPSVFSFVNFRFL